MEKKGDELLERAESISNEKESSNLVSQKCFPWGYDKLVLGLQKWTVKKCCTAKGDRKCNAQLRAGISNSLQYC